MLGRAGVAANLGPHPVVWRAAAHQRRQRHNAVEQDELKALLHAITHDELEFLRLRRPRQHGGTVGDTVGELEGIVGPGGRHFGLPSSDDLCGGGPETVQHPARFIKSRLPPSGICPSVTF